MKTGESTHKREVLIVYIQVEKQYTLLLVLKLHLTIDYRGFPSRTLTLPSLNGRRGNHPNESLVN